MGLVLSIVRYKLCHTAYSNVDYQVIIKNVLFARICSIYIFTYICMPEEMIVASFRKFKIL